MPGIRKATAQFGANYKNLACEGVLMSCDALYEKID